MDVFFVIPQQSWDYNPRTIVSIYRAAGVQFYLISWIFAGVFTRRSGGGSDLGKFCDKLVLWFVQGTTGNYQA